MFLNEQCFSLCLDCYRVSCVGKLIVDSDVIHLGSNLTVGCQSNTEHCGRHFAIVFNGETIFETINCSVIKTQIVINQPSFWLLCKVKEGDKWHTVCGQDFKAGCKFICYLYSNTALKMQEQIFYYFKISCFIQVNLTLKG